MITSAELPQRNSLLQNVGHALGIRLGEGKLFLLLFGQAFWIGVTIICLYSAANALFLAEFGSTFVPYIYIVAGIINILVGLLFVRLERQMSFSNLMLGALGFLVVSVSAFWVGLWLALTPWLIFGTMVWTRIVWVLANLELWALSGRLFNVRQGKRLFPLVGAGSILGVIVAGLSTSLLINSFGTVNLLLIASISLLIAFGFLGLIVNLAYQTLNTSSRNTSSRGSEAKSKSSPLRRLLRNRYILLFYILSALAVFSSYTVEFSLFTEASLRYDNSADIGNFFGSYMGISTIFVLVVALFTKKLFDRFGLKAGILFKPLLIGLCVTVTLISNALWELGPFLFWLVVVARFSDDATMGLRNTGRNILYQPLPDDVRVRVQTAVESILVPLCLGLVGGMLLLVNAVGGLDTITVYYLLLGILIVWLVTVVWLDREYTGSLKRALTRRQFRPQGDPLTIDTQGLSILRQALASPQASNALYTLEILAEHEPDAFRTVLPQMLAHPAPEIRQFILEKLIQDPVPDLLPTVRTMISTETDPSMQGLVLHTFAALGQADTISELIPYLQHASNPVKRGAMLGLLMHGGMEGALFAGQTLWQMVNAPQAAERAMAAQILGEIGVQAFQEQVAQLLTDPNSQVQQAAITAAGQIKHPNLWPVIIDYLTNPRHEAVAKATLIQGGETALPALTTAFDTSQASPLRIQLAHIMGQIGGQAVITCLNAHLDVTDPTLRGHILKGLSRSGYQPPAEDNDHVKQQISQEVEAAIWLLAILVAVEAHQPSSNSLAFLQMALEDRLTQHQTHLFYLLSFLYDSQAVLRAQEIYAYKRASSREKGYALEMIDLLLSQDLHTMIFPLLQPLSSRQKLDRLTPIFPQADLDLAQSLRLLIYDDRTTLWLQTCALYALASHPQSTLATLVTPQLAAPDPLVREAAWLALIRNEPLTLDQLAQLRRDDIPAIARLVDNVSQTPLRKRLMLSTLERLIFLKRVDLFAQIPGNELVRVAQTTMEVTFAPDQTFIKEGDLGDCLYIIVTGEVQIVRDGVGQIARLGAEDVIGDMAILASSPRTASAIAETEITALKIEREAFQELLTEKPELALGIINVLVQRLDQANQKVLNRAR